MFILFLNMIDMFLSRTTTKVSNLFRIFEKMIAFCINKKKRGFKNPSFSYRYSVKITGAHTALPEP